METIVLASNNKNKIKEFKKILKNYNIIPMEDIGFEQDIVEDGKTFLDNSLIKTNTIAKILQRKRSKLYGYGRWQWSLRWCFKLRTGRL